MTERSIQVALTGTKKYTIEDIYALPEGQRAELIDGQIYDIALPNMIHQRIVTRLSSIIDTHIRQKNDLCEVFVAPFAVFLNADNKNYVEPDISIICDKNKLDEYGCNGAPDWVIEIVSPSSRRMDYITKSALYSDAGVKEYWIVDPKKETTLVYHFEEDVAPTMYPFNAPVPFGLFPDLTVTISKLLG